jgi:GT2 family glycosyltransferase
MIKVVQPDFNAMNDETTYTNDHGGRGDEKATVFVLIPVFNRCEDTRQCLTRLRTVRWDGTLQVVVVDDGSTDGTNTMLRDDFPEVRVIQGDGELWWTGSMDKAITELRERLTDKDFVFTLNNDALVDVDTISILVDTSRKNEKAMVAASVRTPEGRCLAAGARMLWRGSLAESLGEVLGDTPNEETEIEADVLFGRATLIPASVLDRIGGYNPDAFPQYFGDSDFSLRAKRAGVRQIITLKTAVTGTEDESTTGIHYNVRRGIGPVEAIRLLTSRRSNLNIVFAARFMWRHAPPGRKIVSAARLVGQNIFAVAMATHLGLLLKVIRRGLKIVARIGQRLGQLLDPRPRCLNFFELSRLGFYPNKLLSDKIIRESVAPHTYHVILPLGAYLRRWRLYWPLIARAYNPAATWRCFTYIRRQREKMKRKSNFKT